MVVYLGPGRRAGEWTLALGYPVLGLGWAAESFHHHDSKYGVRVIFFALQFPPIIGMSRKERNKHIYNKAANFQSGWIRLVDMQLTIA